mmetsp:Transcript_38157/g.82962  ORF Transcript_38157/g.82962 Transcript_38157/m.82962 type:complete len:516 (+) Transcript_38157:234-1781(+)
MGEGERLLSSPDHAKYRSIDSFFDEAAAAATSESSARNSATTTNNPYTRIRFPWRYLLIIVSIGTANASFCTAILLISYLLADNEFNSTVMRDDPDHWAGPLAAAVFAGMLPGGLLAGTICDSWVGRKPLLLITLTANVTTAIWTAFVNGPIGLILCRFLAGIAIGATEPPLFALATELSPPKHRGLCVSFVASFWMVGNLVVAVVGLVVFRYLVWSWRYYVLICATPAVLGLLMLAMCVPESPRFLAYVRRDIGGAVSSANRIAVSLGMDASSKRLLRKEELMDQYSLELHQGEESEEQKEKSLLETFASLYHPQLRFATTIPLQITWFSLCFGSYALVTWINTIYVQIHLDDLYWNLLWFALANAPGNLLSFFLLDKVGRIKTLVGSLTMSAMSLVVFAWYSRPDHTSTAGVVVSSCTFQALETVAWNVMDTATGELFPTTSRSTGIGLCTATGRLGAMAAQFASGLLIDSPVMLLLVSSLSFLIAAVIPMKLQHGEMSQARLNDYVGGADAN